MNVKLNVSQSTNTLVCNAADLNIIEVQINGKSVDDIVLSKDEETMTVRVASPLQELMEADLFCKFKGELNDMMLSLIHI